VIILLLLEVVLLIGLSAICSGLNIGLMSLDPNDLRRKAKLGNSSAIRVLPLRERSHLSLASIILTNIAVISATSLVLGTRMNGFIAGSLGTLLIVIFGEILPQAMFTRHALAFCDRFSPLLKLMIIVTYPISKPLQVALDKLFAAQGTPLESRDELGLIINEHLLRKGSEIDEDEIEIMRGALSLSDKRVRDITTPLRNVYWLTPESVIDADKIDEIKARAWSRIPILSEDKTECHGVLLMKDLVDIDFDERPYTIDELKVRPTKVVGNMTALDTMFRKFIAARSHLMPVEKDDKIIGIITIEDLIEEIIGHEIEDEADRDRHS
jgi:metal transporter CNNM